MKEFRLYLTKIGNSEAENIMEYVIMKRLGSKFGQILAVCKAFVLQVLYDNGCTQWEQELINCFDKKLEEEINLLYQSLETLKEQLHDKAILIHNQDANDWIATYHQYKASTVNGYWSDETVHNLFTGLLITIARHTDTNTNK